MSQHFCSPYIVSALLENMSGNVRYGFQGAVSLRFRMVLRGIINKLCNEHWSLPRAAVSTANQNNVDVGAP